MITASDICQLEEKLLSCVLEQHDNSDSFHPCTRDILYSSQRDYIFGGIFDGSANATKSLANNARLAKVFLLAANYFGDSNYARLALETLTHLTTYHQKHDGLYVEQSRFTDTALNVEKLKSYLTESQWLALNTCFGITDTEVIQWPLLQTVVPMEQVSQHSGLHPKEVPLALDGSLQILNSLISGPEQLAEVTILSNLQLCESLYLSAIYLNQSEHGLVADALYSQLTDNDLADYKPELLSLLLIKLRYQWNNDAYEQLEALYTQINQQGQNQIKDIDADDLASTELLIQSFKQSSINPFVNNIRHLAGIVIIYGPEFLTRQWLHETNNRLQLNHRFFAITGPQGTNSGNTSAQLIRTDGTNQKFLTLEDLLSLSV